MSPDERFPKKLVRHYIPIIIETMLAGETLVTSESPTGDRYNSPMVSTSVADVSQKIDTFGVECSAWAAPIMMRNEMPSRMHPMAILFTLDGSVPFLN